MQLDSSILHFEIDEKSLNKRLASLLEATTKISDSVKHWYDEFIRKIGNYKYSRNFCNSRFKLPCYVKLEIPRHAIHLYNLVINQIQDVIDDIKTQVINELKQEAYKQNNTQKNNDWFDESQKAEFEIIDEDKALTCFEFLNHLSDTKIKIQTFFRAITKGDFSWWKKVFENQNPNKIRIGLATMWKSKIVNPLKKWKEKVTQSIGETIEKCNKAWGEYRDHEGLRILQELGLKFSPKQKDTINRFHLNP